MKKEKRRQYSRDIKRYKRENKEAETARAFFILAGIVGLVWYFRKPIGSTVATGVEKVMSTVRGVRNKNLLNIKFNKANNWQGQTGSDGTFSIFDTVENGLRAGFIILKNYKKRGIDTLPEIIATFAPNSENDTENYISFVANRANVPVNRPLTIAEEKRVIAAMVKMETGQTISPDVVERAFQMSRA
jgi:hypothetical protein